MARAFREVSFSSRAGHRGYAARVTRRQVGALSFSPPCHPRAQAAVTSGLPRIVTVIEDGQAEHTALTSEWGRRLRLHGRNVFEGRCALILVVPRQPNVGSSRVVEKRQATIQGGHRRGLPRHTTVPAASDAKSLRVGLTLESLREHAHVGRG
jgi:hypothetical protein